MQKKIQQKQNESFFLKCQFAARYNFNKAEIMNKLIWICCILSAFSIFIPDTMPWVGICVPLIIDIFGIILEFIFRKSISNAALLRNYFDTEVLSIKTTQYSDSETRNIKSIIEKTCRLHSKKCSEQIKTNSSASPPGVKDWYEFSHDFSDVDVQHECQLQNCYWTDELRKSRLICSFVIAIVAIAAICIITKYGSFNDEPIKIVLSSAILLKCGERLKAHYDCHSIILKTQGARRILENSKCEENIKTFQTMIQERRELPVLEINFIHKKRAKKISQHYKSIS